MFAQRANFWCLAAAIFLVFGCKPQIDPVESKNGSLLPPPRFADNVEPGIFDKSLVGSTGDIIRYTVAIPKTYDATKPTPLIVGLHFGGKVTPHYARGIVEILVLPGLGDLNAIVIAPDSIAGGWDNDRNEDMVLELMDYVATKYNIDPDRCILTGFSMGGHGTWYIGGRNQNRFSALIPIAGAPSLKEGVKWTTPIYAIHSRADEVVPIDPTEKFVAEQKSAGNEDIVFVALEGLPHYQTARFAVPLRDAVPWVKKIWSTQ